MSMWYPSKVPETLPSTAKIYEKEQNLPCPEHEVFRTGGVRFTAENVWSKTRGVSKQMRANARRTQLHGVEPRDLPVSHVLAGQQGLFATRMWHQFDVLGEYCGEVVPSSCSGEYVACLEDKPHAESLGLDAEMCGNESRFINSYLNVAPYPNVAMKTVYVDALPRIVLVVTKLTIEAGDEILLDYGQGYTDAFFTKPADPAVLAEEEAAAAALREATPEEEAAAHRKVLKGLPKFARPEGVSSESESSDEDN